MNDREKMDEQALQAEILRLNKIVNVLMNRAESNASVQGSDFNLFHTAVALDEQVRRRTRELDDARLENEKITRALRESEEKFRLLIENSHDIIYTLDKEGNFTFLSPAWSSVMGYSINQAMEHGRGAAGLEPGEGAGVELGQLAQGRLPGPPAAVLGGAAPALGRLPKSSAEGPHRGSAHGEPMPLLQFLGQVDVVEADVGRGHQHGDLLPGLRGQVPVAGASPEGVEQPTGSLRAEALLHPLKLPHGHVQRPCSLLVGDAAGQGGLHQAGPRHFLPAHRECLHGVTFL